ncbi:MAG: hypothetical protein V9G98_19270 [Candidatus Competibacter sp.]
MFHGVFEGAGGASAFWPVPVSVEQEWRVSVEEEWLAWWQSVDRPAVSTNPRE